MKGKVIKAISAVLIVCLIGGSGYYFYNKSSKAKAASNTTRYYTVAAQKSNIDVTVSATGTAEATQTKDVVANNSGTIQNLNVNVGDTVKQGDTIAKVQDDSIDQAVSKSNLTVQQQQLQVNNAKNANDQQMQELTLQSDQNDLNSKIEQQNQMTLTAPIGGVVVAKNNNTGDSVQAGKALITIADLSAIKVDVQVDELDISKVKVGQAADIKFDAISDKSYTGTVESISQMGTTTNNVTTYDVIVDVNNPDGVKLGMTANVDIKVTSKADALTIPIEALIERNNKKYVMLKTNSTNTTSTQGSWSKNSNSGSSQGNGGSGSYRRNSSNGSFGANSRISMSGGKLVEVQTGLENETTVEITSGLTEGQQVMIQLPQVSSTTSQRSSSGFGGLGGGSYGGFSGGSKNSGNNGGNSNNSSSNSSSSNNSSSNNSSGNSGSGK